MQRAHLLTAGAAAGLLSLAASAAPAQPDAVQAWSGGRTAVAWATDRGVVLELPEGRRLELPAPAGSGVDSLTARSGGWAAAGTFRAADGRRRLWIAAAGKGDAKTLPEPGGQAGTLRQGPVLLAADGHLAGLAWLEGDGQRALSVRAAPWKDGRWSRPELVSGVGSGSQLALAGAVLADGSWLLAWSAFDGRDDEVVWSRRAEGRWQRVERLSPDNDVPDVTPDLLPAPGGALAAWSRFDGSDYRLVVARLADGRWGEERTIGEAGSLYPSFGLEAAGPYLLYLTARPRGWALLGLDEAGTVRSRAAAASERAARPALVAGAEGRMGLRWPGAGEEDLIRLEQERP